ncbi:hypothetical protein FUAX_07000 [Fulvitalea axinellae]|uniref:Bacteriocin-protection protein, YdeI/OmpD-associated family n=1 Tax=Fulvitalea axinellae TaxID=1182444 RepID=A0AAU9CJU9_9BACT|nr:hypothetical protein FUAX_07000 [Fulvitalea axinellae]
MRNTEEYCPSNKEEWRRWLELNHIKKDTIWLIFHRKGTPNYNLSWSDSVDEALCFGWIDSTKKTIDSERYKQYFRKRKAKSNWSKINKQKVENLIQQGLMTEEGFKSIKIAKENGSWTFLDEVEELKMPDDLIEELMKFDGAKDYFDSLSKSEKKHLLYWVISAKREETRRKRIIEIAENAGRQMKPKSFR